MMETYTPDNVLEKNENVEQIPENISLLPLKNAVIYPDVTMPIVISGAAIQLVEKALSERRMFGVVTQQSGDISEPQPKDLYAVGTVVRIIRMVRSPEGEVYVFVQGLARMKILEYLQEKPYYVVRIQTLRDRVVADQELSAMFKSARNLFQEIAKLNPSISQEILTVAINIESPGMLADMLAEYPSLSVQERQELLEILDVKQRLHRIMQLLIREKEHLELAQQIRSQAQGEMEKGQREYYLRKQLEAIKKELGESDQEAGEIGELQKRIGEVRLPEEVKKTAEKELDRLSKMHPSSAEHTVSRTYLDWILDLPWKESSEDNLNVAEAEHVLEEDHYGLEKVKKRILEYLAVRQLTHESKGPILCFVGPPGVGKTSLGKSIARALDRKFVRMSLGGIRDEAEIRGHRRTYIGALPGRIIQGLKKAGSNNPVFMLDEIDKVGADFRGDPASALLEVLDPEQNKEFSDHYLELPFDLSRVLFITTANTLMTIPPALLDRMEVIKISGYTEEEKVMIAKQYLVPRQLKAHGLISEQLAIDESALKTIIRSYTREAGVRNLEREIAAICRGVAREIVNGLKKPVQVDADNVSTYLGPVKFFSELAERTSTSGVATGLAWTPFGGDLLFIETTKMKGKEKLILTGQLGDVMKESAEIALSYIRSKAKDLGIPENFADNTDIHVHIPSGAIPKDGPSAGVTLYTSLVSLLKNQPARSDTAMTGEVTLRGLVLPVGGIKEKVLAARNAGVKHVILPEKNKKDLDEIPQNVKEDLSFHFVHDMDAVIKFALDSSQES